MSHLVLTPADVAERALGRAILLVAHARGHLAVRGQTNTRPLAEALANVGEALAATDTTAAARLLPRVRALTEGLASLVAELAAGEGSGSAPSSLSAVA